MKTPQGKKDKTKLLKWVILGALLAGTFTSVRAEA